ncbi:MAG: ATPase [Ignavibacteriaceae bacterium]
MSLTILCISSYEKGHDFMRECKAQGCKVLLLTSKSLENADWPRDCIDEIYYMPDKNKEWEIRDVIYGVSFLCRTETIDKIVALDDFDVEKAATLREHLRIPGMGETTARYFRDKLAMRNRAYEEDIPVPEFLHVLNHYKLRKFSEQVKFPCIIKPRMLAGAHGLKKVHNADEMWERINQLGDEQSFYLIERFVEGDIYHVDSIIYEKEIKFALASRYGTPPMEVAHQGRVFTTQTVKYGSDEENKLLELNTKVISAMGLVRGISHTEFIRAAEDSKFYFLETSARVGGAHIGEFVEAASGINLWKEWAKIEILGGKKPYKVPPRKFNYAALIISLAKMQWPDLSSFEDKEVLWRLKKPFHAGLIISSDDENRIGELMKNYIKRFYEEFFTSQPLPDKPSA